MSEAIERDGHPLSALNDQSANGTENAAGGPRNEETPASRIAGHGTSPSRAKDDGRANNKDPHDCMAQTFFCCLASCTIL
jgi:hypothetical protein